MSRTPMNHPYVYLPGNAARQNTAESLFHEWGRP